MAKKKRKTFPKNELLALFRNQNYQKVVSKIKQFAIEDMESSEVDSLHVDSLKILSDERFKVGDIQRAIRDIELAINIKADETLEFLRLKYLCYLENFSEAKLYADALLQKYKTNKNIIFYSLLIELYLGNTIDDKQFKKVTKAKQEYLLAIAALFNDDTQSALKHLNNSKPRAKAEKNSIEALKAILLQKTELQIKDIKPLYRFLLFGDDTNLQNSRNVRNFRDEIIKNFKQSGSAKNLNKLIAQEGYIDDVIVKKENNPKLALNNITMMLEKKEEPDYIQIYKIFISYEKKFLQTPESIYVLVDIFKNFDIATAELKIVSFVEKYLEIHAEKLAPFAIKYILYRLLSFSFKNEKSVKMIESLYDKYDNKDIFYTTLTFAITYNTLEMYDKYKEYIDNVFKKYSYVNSMVIKDMVQFIESFEYVLMFLDADDTKHAIKKIETTLYVIKNISDVDVKYKSLFLRLLNAYAIALSSFDENELEKGYDDIKAVLKKYIDMFGYEESQFCEDAEEFLNGSVNIQNDFTPNIIQEKYIKFKLALKTGTDPFVALENYPDMYVYFYIEENETAVFDLIMEYARFEDLDDKVIAKIFRLTHFAYKAEFLRTTIQTILTQYAQEHLEVSQKIFQYILKITNSQSVWYLNWLYSYMDMIDTHNLEKDAFFIRCLHIFLDIQGRKKFKTIQKRYELVIRRFATWDVEDTTEKNQQTFEF